MRNYQRLVWVPNQNTCEDIQLKLCTECGAVVGNETYHEAWHERIATLTERLHVTVLPGPPDFELPWA